MRVPGTLTCRFSYPAPFLSTNAATFVVNHNVHILPKVSCYETCFYFWSPGRAIAAAMYSVYNSIHQTTYILYIYTFNEAHALGTYAGIRLLHIIPARYLPNLRYLQAIASVKSGYSALPWLSVVGTWSLRA